MPMNTGNFGALLWPGISKVYGLEYKDHPEEYSEIFDEFSSDKSFEEDLMVTGFGQASEKSQGAAVQYDTAQQGFKSRYNMTTYGLGFIVTREMYEDDQYNTIMKYSRALARSMRKTKEVLGANVLNNGFDNTYTGGDGLELFSTAHININGGTWQNELTTAADLSEASLEQAYIDIGGFTDDRGLIINARPTKLIVPRQLEFEATRILKTDGRVGTADNDLNAIKSMGGLPFVVNHYLTDTDAWFLKTDVMDGLKYYNRREMEFTQDNDFDTENAKYKATFRCDFGWTDPRGAYGTPGAA